MLTPWIQVNFNAIVYITGLTTQGYYYGVSLVETYTAKYGNSSSFLSFVSTSSGSVQMVSTVLVGHVFHCPPTAYSHLLTTGLSPVLLREYGTTVKYASNNFCSFSLFKNTHSNLLVSDVICCMYSSIGFALFSALVLMKRHFIYI